MKRAGLVLTFLLLLNLAGILTLEPAQAALNAAIVSNDVPLSVYPGDVLAVTVAMSNTGDSSPADDWTFTDPNFFRLRSISVPDNTWTTFAVNILSGETITPGNTKTFTFYIIAPSIPGSYAFTWQMMKSGSPDIFFGEILDLDIDVNLMAQASHYAVPISDNIPLQLAPGELRYIEITMNNSGTSHWINTTEPPYAPRYKLFSQNSPYDFWSTWYVNLESTDDIAPGNNKTFAYYIIAPLTTGTFNFNWQMQVNTLNQGDILFNQLFERQIEVTNAVNPALDAEFVSHTIPATLVPGETREVTITMRNPATATTSWIFNNYRLFSLNDPYNLWAGPENLLAGFVSHLSPDNSIEPGEEMVFPLTITAPLVSGTYTCNWRMMVPTSQHGNMFFGDTVLHSITVGEECSNGESRLCPNQNGVCAGSEEVCSGSQWPGCNYTTIPGYETTEATCNDTLDNDCDGLTDIADTDCSVPPEICDNLVDDNDNALIDCADPECEGFVFEPTACGIGVCSAAGQLICSGGSPVDTCLPGSPTEEPEVTCNDSLDNDCDGLTDAADVLDCAVATEICNNLVDDDGDGQIDCADTDCDGQACNDEDACSTGESCSGGLCRGGSAITCNDSNICTDNHCNPASGCYYTNNTVPCNDNTFCNGTDTCAAGSCSAHSGTPCQDGETCNEDTDSCVPEAVCGNGSTEEGEDCDDGNVLNGDCCSATCTFEAVDSPCADGLYCNGYETCDGAGTCHAVSNPCAYCDLIGCTCNETADSCTGCDSDDDCDGVCNPGESAPDCIGLDNCPINPNPGQEDIYPPDGNGIGNACDCEGNFNCDADVDGGDAFLFKSDFGRSILVNRCTNTSPCNGDFNCDGDVDGADAFILKTDFGRSSIVNPCPACIVGDWCSY